MRLSVIIPVYNAQNFIGDTLRAVSDWFAKQNFDYEIIVVSDGSKDRTAEAVDFLKSQIPHLTLIDNKENHGKGWVVRQGMLAAAGDLRLFMDDDNSTSIDHLSTFLPYIDQGYEVVIGSIEVKGAKINEHAQWYRRFLGHLSKILIRIVAGLWEIKDTQRGFKLFTARAAQTIFPKVTISRWGFDFEVLALAKKFGFKIKEVPVNWNNPSGSRVHLSSYILTLKELLKVRWNFLTGKYN